MATPSTAQPRIRILTVSGRAIGAYREILGRDWITKTNEQVREQMMEELGKLLPKWEVLDTTSPEEPTFVFELYAPGGVRYAVVRDEAVITLLDEEKVAKNLKGNWIRPKAVAFEAELAAIVAAPVLSVVPDPAAVLPAEVIARGGDVAPQDVVCDTALPAEIVRCAIRIAELEIALGRERAKVQAAEKAMMGAEAELHAELKKQREHIDRELALLLSRG